VLATEAANVYVCPVDAVKLELIRRVTESLRSGSERPNTLVYKAKRVSER